MVDRVTRVFATPEQLVETNEAVAQVRSLTDTARDLANRNINTREALGRTASVRRMNNTVNPYQYNAALGEIVTADSNGNVIPARALGNSLYLNTQPTLKSDQTRSVIWKVQKA